MRWLAPFCSLLVLASSLPAQTTDNTMRDAIRQAYDIPAQLPPLESHLWSSAEAMPGVSVDRVTYNTADGMVVPALIFRPTRPHKGKLPGMVVVNGHGQDKYGWYSFYSGLMFAKAGAVVVTYDTIGEGERNAGRKSLSSPSPHDAGAPDGIPFDAWGRRVAGLMQVDFDQALRYLASRPDVDTKRLGAVGFSMGAYITGIAGAELQDYSPKHPDAPHFHALLLSGGGTYDDNTGYFDVNKNPCQGPPYRALKPLMMRDGKPERGYDIFYLNAKRGPTLVMNGLGDHVMDIPHHDADWFAAMRARVVATPGLKPENIFTSITYPATVDHRPSWVTVEGVEWLNKQLHFANWKTDAEIQAQGTTHISEWVIANHAQISKNYLVESREGGLHAVGQGFPALTREQMTVLPDAEWEKMQSKLTYAAWREKVAAEMLAAAK
ncbi:MAG: acetylxylan esterase [Acidobacteriaceae bacterium]|nr:acetylxylan esterase [Acidobacteriaceae bacterium]